MVTIWESMPAYWKFLLEDVDDNEEYTYLMSLDKVSQSKEQNRMVYNMYINDDSMMFKYTKRWIERGLRIDEETYRKAFNILYDCTHISKFRDFQYRLNLGKMTLNEDLCMWGITESNLCNLCKEEVETMTHLFYNCKYMQILVKYVYDLCELNCIEYSSEASDFILNTFLGQRSNIINFVAILAKQFVFRCRCQQTKLSVQKFICELEVIHNIEWAIAKAERKSDKHVKKWNPIFTYC